MEFRSLPNLSLFRTETLRRRLFAHNLGFGDIGTGQLLSVGAAIVGFAHDRARYATTRLCAQAPSAIVPLTTNHRRPHPSSSREQNPLVVSNLSDQS
jgi:hypothetical protein